jgi:hypothetical protein
VLSSRVVRDKEMEDLAGLESSVARKDVAVEARAEEQSLLQEGGTEGPTVGGTSAQVERMQ